MPALLRNPVLSRCVPDPDAVPKYISAAGLQASRFAALDRSKFFFSSGESVYKISRGKTRKRLRSADAEKPEIEADDYLIPFTSYDLDVTADVRHSSHRAEVMSIAARGSRLASVDADGVCILSVGGGDDGESSYVLHPPSLRDGEDGWAGVALNWDDCAAVATARQRFRDVSVYDGDICVRTVHTMAEPGGISYLGSTSTLAVAEGSALALYETRVGERSSCVARKMPGLSQMLSIDSSDDFTIAVAGKDRTVHVFDTRTMTFRERWSGCLKYECAGVKLSVAQAGMSYVTSVDNEFACGAWCSKQAATFDATESRMLSGANTKSPRRYYGFRADARVIGMDTLCDDGGEFVALLSETCGLYLLDC